MEHQLTVLNGSLLLQNGDLLQWYIGCQLILKAVYLDELPVEFFFVAVKLEEYFRPFRFVIVIYLLNKYIIFERTYMN